MKSTFDPFVNRLQSIHGSLHTSFMKSFYSFKGYWKSVFRKPASKAEDYPIDFVVTWVNSNDPEWKKKKREYDGSKDIPGAGEERYRDWDFFVYWFRAVEKYAPWVNKVYVITDNQVPSFLVDSHPKLRIVDHSEIIPKDKLPVFNCNAMEVSLHKIIGLSEHFVYFNDDVFLTAPIDKSFFFQNGLPCYCAVAEPYRPNITSSYYQYILCSIFGVINSKLSVRDAIKKCPEKWFSKKYGFLRKYNKRILEDGYINGMNFTHLAYPYLKSACEDACEAVPDLIDNTRSQRFRTAFDLSHQLFLLWELLHGQFEPVEMDYYGKFYNINVKNADTIMQNITNQTHSILCINDNDHCSHKDYLMLKEQLNMTFEQVFPDKSSFEK